MYPDQSRLLCLHQSLNCSSFSGVILLARWQWDARNTQPEQTVHWYVVCQDLDWFSYWLKPPFPFLAFAAISILMAESR